MENSPIENIGARHFRRKRKFQGATWTPGTVSATPEDGIWCPEHRLRHGYKTKQLGVYFEKDTHGKWKALWYCVATGAVLLEMGLGNAGQQARISD